MHSTGCSTAGCISTGRSCSEVSILGGYWLPPLNVPGAGPDDPNTVSSGYWFKYAAGVPANSRNILDWTGSLVADNAPGLGDSRLMRGGRAVDPQGAGYGTVDNSDGRFDPGAQDLVIEWHGEVPAGVAQETVVSHRETTNKWQARWTSTNITLVTYEGAVPQVSALNHGLSSGDFTRVRIVKTGSSWECFVGGVSIGTGTAKSNIDAGTEDLNVLRKSAASDFILSELKITIAGEVVGWWATGVEGSGSVCPSLLSGGKPINWVNQPAGFFVTNSFVGWNPADDWGYKQDIFLDMPATTGNAATIDTSEPTIDFSQEFNLTFNVAYEGGGSGNYDIIGGVTVFNRVHLLDTERLLFYAGTSSGTEGVNRCYFSAVAGLSDGEVHEIRISWGRY